MQIQAKIKAEGQTSLRLDPRINKHKERMIAALNY